MSTTADAAEPTAFPLSTHIVRDDSMSSASAAHSSVHRCSTPSTSLQDQSPPTNDSTLPNHAQDASEKKHVHRRTLSWRRLPKEVQSFSLFEFAFCPVSLHQHVSAAPLCSVNTVQFNIFSLLRSRSTTVRRRSPLDLVRTALALKCQLLLCLCTVCHFTGRVECRPGVRAWKHACTISTCASGIKQ